MPHIRVRLMNVAASRLQMFGAQSTSAMLDTQSGAERIYGQCRCKCEPVGFSTVLVVDDEPVIRAATCERLRDVGWRALEARDAQAAIQILEGSELVHLAFSD